eukprot:525617-Hanusia_phi.AAC.1
MKERESRRAKLIFGSSRAAGLTKGASAAEIKAAHRKLIICRHPDRTSSLPEEEKVVAEERCTYTDTETLTSCVQS